MIHVLYHKNCYDGFGAAFCAWMKFGDDASYIPMDYSDSVPYHQFKHGDTVYMLDYSRKHLDLFEMSAHSLALDIRIIDHHKTALEEILLLDKVYGGVNSLNLAFDEKSERCVIGKSQNYPFKFVIDLDKSGAGLSWEYFLNPDGSKEMPMMIQAIQDRDLWRWQVDGSKAFHAFLCSKPFDFVVWLDIYKSYYDLCVRFGGDILNYHGELIDRLCKEVFFIVLDGYKVPCVNTSLLFSEVPQRLLQLYEDAPFACYFYGKGNSIIVGLRSRSPEDDKQGRDVDVSEIAKKLGGGGHKRAAGFQLPPHYNFLTKKYVEAV